MSVTSRFSQHLKSNPEVAKFLMPGTKYEVLLDLNGDGKMDFAFIDQKGTGTPDTFAIDLTGNGELNLYYFDLDGNGKADTLLSYPDGRDTPNFNRTTKESEERLQKALGGIPAAMRSNDPQVIKDCLFGIRDNVLEASKSFGKTGTLARMRLAMKADPDMAKLLCSSPKNELFFDLNDDGVADFALCDSNHSGEIDTMGFDLTGDGEFDLYINDTDDNGISDHLLVYKPGEEEPTVEASGSRLEEALRPATMKFIITLRSHFDAKTLVKAMKAYRKDVVAVAKSVIG